MLLAARGVNSSHIPIDYAYKPQTEREAKRDKLFNGMGMGHSSRNRMLRGFGLYYVVSNV